MRGSNRRVAAALLAALAAAAPAARAQPTPGAAATAAAPPVLRPKAADADGTREQGPMPPAAANSGADNPELGLLPPGAAVPNVNGVPYPYALPPELMEPPFKGAEQRMYPMTPEQIKQFGQYLQQMERATSQQEPSPKPRARLVEVDMTPGTSPVTIDLADRYVTALVFVDAEGYPWPATLVESARRVFQAAILKTGKHNVVTVTPLKRYAEGNLVVALDGADQPVAFLLRTSDQVADYRVTVRIVGRSPAAPAAAVAAGGNGLLTVDPGLREAVQGLVPEGAKPAALVSAPGEAWQAGGTLYLRSPWRLVWPAWRAHVDLYGMHGYELDETPEVLLVSDDGKTHLVKVGPAEGGNNG